MPVGRRGSGEGVAAAFGGGHPGDAGRHLPDAEAWWPSLDESPHAGQVWAIETELTPKTAARTAVIMAGLAAAGYDRILYFTAPAARPAVLTAAAVPAAPIAVHDLLQDAFPPGA